jgi:hypothetical protein
MVCPGLTLFNANRLPEALVAPPQWVPRSSLRNLRTSAIQFDIFSTWVAKMSNSTVPTTALAPAAAPTVPPDDIWGTFFVPGARFALTHFQSMSQLAIFTFQAGPVAKAPTGISRSGDHSFSLLSLSQYCDDFC